MGRPRKKDTNLPPCIYKQHGAYYLVKRGKWERLGEDLSRALAEYGRKVSGRRGSMPDLIDKALASMRGLSESTTKQYKKTGEKLKRVFRDFEPGEVLGRHVARMKAEYSGTPFYANRLLSLLRLVFSYAVDAQLVDTNPCADIKPHKEKARTRYVTDAEYAAIYEQAGPRLKAIMDLLYLTAQRPVDILSLRRDQIREEGLYFEQKKTGARVLVSWTPELREAIGRAGNLHGNVKSLTLFHNRRGKAPDYSTVKLQWDKARKLANVTDAQLRDIRAKAITDTDAQGNDPQVIAGHASQGMTRRYLRLRKTVVAIGPSFRRRQILD